MPAGSVGDSSQSLSRTPAPDARFSVCTEEAAIHIYLRPLQVCNCCFSDQPPRLRTADFQRLIKITCSETSYLNIAGLHPQSLRYVA
jgi:hypothetical protein